MHASVFFRHGARAPVHFAFPGLKDVEWSDCDAERARKMLHTARLTDLSGAAPAPVSHVDAAQRGETDKVRPLLNGVNIDCQDTYGWTPLWCAASWAASPCSAPIQSHTVDALVAALQEIRRACVPSLVAVHRRQQPREQTDGPAPWRTFTHFAG